MSFRNLGSQVAGFKLGSGSLMHLGEFGRCQVMVILPSDKEDRAEVRTRCVLIW